jgi:hypothetical protein
MLVWIFVRLRVEHQHPRASRVCNSEVGNRWTVLFQQTCSFVAKLQYSLAKHIHHRVYNKSKVHPLQLVVLVKTTLPLVVFVKITLPLVVLVITIGQMVGCYGNTPLSLILRRPMRPLSFLSYLSPTCSFGQNYILQGAILSVGSALKRQGHSTLHSTSLRPHHASSASLKRFYKGSLDAYETKAETQRPKLLNRP